MSVTFTLPLVNETDNVFKPGNFTAGRMGDERRGACRGRLDRDESSVATTVSVLAVEQVCAVDELAGYESSPGAAWGRNPISSTPGPHP